MLKVAVPKTMTNGVENAGMRVESDEPIERMRTAPASAPGTLVSHEDIDRAQDRKRVLSARSRGGFPSRLRLLWLLVGPGILVMLGENDGPSMITYAATGARFGVGFFVPLIILTFAMSVVVQEMTMRVGAATHRGHAELIFARFGPFWGWFAVTDLAIGNFLTLITEFIAIRAGLGFFGIPPLLAIVVAIVVVYFALFTHRYWTWERITLAVAAFNLVFIPLAILARPDWHSVGNALITWRPLVGGISNSTLLMTLAITGATVTPWMIFFQQSATVDKGLTRKDIRFGRIDTVLGAVLAASAALGMVLVTAPLVTHHMSAEQFQAAEFAQSLEPVIGRLGAALFALGIVEAGLVAAITISVSSAYAFGEVARQPHSLNLKFSQGRLFYSILFLGVAGAAAAVLIPGLPLVYIVLIVNVVAVLAMPPALAFLFMLVNDREIMGDLVNPRWANMLAAGVGLLLVAAGAIFAMSVVAPKVFAALGNR